MSASSPQLDLLFAGTPDRVPKLSGRDLRDSGIESAFDHVLQVKAEYVVRCLAEITKLGSGTLFTSEALRDLAGEPPEGCENSMAGILKRAASQKLIRNTGEERVAERVTIHAKKLCIWIRL
jgi:hypothetical protein